MVPLLIAPNALGPFLKMFKGLSVLISQLDLVSLTQGVFFNPVVNTWRVMLSTMPGLLCILFIFEIIHFGKNQNTKFTILTIFKCIVQ